MRDWYRFTHRGFHRAAIALAIALAALFMASGRALAQKGSPFGTHFIFAFPDTAQHHAPRGSEPWVDPSIRIVLFSLDTAHVTVKGPRGTGTVTVLPGSSQVLAPIPSIAWMVNVPSTEMFDITSDRDIAIYCYYTSPYGSEAFRPLPVASWGTEYYVMGLRETTLTDVAYSGDEEGFSFRRAPAEIVIFASEFAQLLVEFPDQIRLPRTYYLNPGEMLILEVIDTSLAQYDFSGIHITSSSPVGVMSGNTRILGEAAQPLLPEITSPMLNAAFEWIPPMDAQGKSFAYRQLASQPGTDVTEIIRVYATAPGYTTVRDTRDNTGYPVQQGSFVELRTNSWVSPQPVPFEITTSQPAQAMVLSGPYTVPSDPNALIPLSFNLWGAAMAELVPRERWINYGRFYAPNYPAALQNYISIVAEPGATVWLDGQAVGWDIAYPRFNYQHAELAVPVGDHSIVARGGRFSAIAYGEAMGYEVYKPVATRKREERSAQRPHPSVYSERIAVTYAYPVSGVPTSGVDSLVISIDEGCDSTIAVARRAPGAWDLVPFASAALDPSSVNTDAAITPIMEFRQVAGYRIVFRPRDPSADASGKVVIANISGKRWEVPFRYAPQGVSVTPSPLDLTGVTAELLQKTSVTVKNVKQSSVVIRGARLKRGSAGFALPDLRGLPKRLAEGEELEIPIDFIGALYGYTYHDTLIIETGCRTLTIPLSSRTNSRPSGPDPHITGYDWRERWVTSVTPCTKNRAFGYDTVITIFNAGGVRFTIASVTLIGPDADSGAFSFGTQPTVAPGDTVGAGQRKGIAIRFRPTAERAYACRVRLIAVDGDTVEADLAGIGIETHLAIDDHDFGAVEQSAGVTVPGSVELRALPTRPLEVRELRIVGGAGEFRFAAGFARPLESDRSSWWRMAPGEKRSIPLEFAPGSVGAKSATIEVIGDQPFCEDSVGALTGSSFTAGVRADRLDFAPALGCAATSGVLTLRNIGGVQLQLVGIELLDATGSFTIEQPALPLLLDPNVEITIPARFAPGAAGAASARVRYITRRAGGSATLDTVESILTGEGRLLRANARIARTYRAYPGAGIVTPIVLEDAIEEAHVDEIVLRLPRRSHVSIATATSAAELAEMLRGTILSDWTATLDPASSADTLVVRLRAPRDAWLRGAGELARIGWTTFIGDSLASELPFTIELPGKGCVDVTEQAGRVTLDSICGMSLRLIELTPANYALDGNRPNPFNPVTEIIFTIGLDAPTRLAVYDGAGREVARLVDGYLGIGRYSVRWDASGYPSGVYRYRIVSGPWSAEGTMVLSK